MLDEKNDAVIVEVAPEVTETIVVKKVTKASQIRDAVKTRIDAGDTLDTVKADEAFVATLAEATDQSKSRIRHDIAYFWQRQG